jgi:hypothetical protein
LAEGDKDCNAAASKQGLNRLEQRHGFAHGGRRDNDNLIKGFDRSRQTFGVKWI